MLQWALYMTPYVSFIVADDINLSQIRPNATLIMTIIM
jgi:hypothetical protein